MRTIHLVLALSIAAVAMPVAIFAGTRIRPVHPERMNLSAAARHDEVMRDLNAVLTGPASPTSVATRAYPSGEPRLCRRDVIRVSYVADGPTAPFKPEGISGIGAQFYLLGENPLKELDARRKACAMRSSTDLNWVFSTEGDHFASDALTVLPMAIDDVRKNRQVALHCEEIEGECDGKLFLTLAPQVSSVSRCQGNTQNCYWFGMGGYDVTVTFEYPGNSRHTLITIAPEPIVLT